MRLFTGLDLPAAVLRNLEELLDDLRPTAPIQWSPIGNLHVTTKFIGEWPEERLPELVSALQALPPRPNIHLRICGSGFFPNERSPRVFWCGVEAPGLSSLARDTDQAAAALGVAGEKRPYSPHLTLARIRQEGVDLRRLRKKVAARSWLDLGSFEAHSFFLYRSQLRPNGSVYTKLAEFPFSKR